MKCYNCPNEHNKKSGYCPECHRKYMRAWRADYWNKTDKKRLKKHIDAYIKEIKKRNRIVIKADLCIICNTNEKVELYNFIASEPKKLIPLCEDCKENIRNVL